MRQRPTLTKHAAKRQRWRGITDEQIDAALDSGHWEQTGHTRVHYDLTTRVGVVVDWHVAPWGEIVTLYHLREDVFARYRAAVAGSTRRPQCKKRIGSQDAQPSQRSGMRMASDGKAGDWRKGLPQTDGYYWWVGAHHLPEAVDVPCLLQVITVPRFVAFVGERPYGPRDVEDGWWCGPIPVPDGWATLKGRKHA